MVRAYYSRGTDRDRNAMTLTIKDSLESASQGKPGSSSQSSEDTHTPSVRANPRDLEVPVTVRSLPGEHGDTPETSVPIREKSKTVIVFDNGAVLRLWNNLPSGQKLILSNAQGDDVVCRVVSGRNSPTVRGYVEIEFIEPFKNFWRIDPGAKPVSTPPVPALPVEWAQPAATAPPASQSISSTPPPFTISESEVTSPTGSAPAFDNIADLLRATSPTVSRTKANDPPSPAGSLKNKNESAPSRNDPQEYSAATGTTLAVADVIETNRVAPPQESSFPPRAKPAPSKDVVARGMLASGQISSSAQNETPSRTPLLLGGAVLFLVISGAAYFFTRPASTPTTTEPLAAAQPAPPVPPVQSSAPVPVQAIPPAPIQPVESRSAEPQPVSTPAPALAAAEAEPSASSNLRGTANNNARAEQPGLQAKQLRQIQNLKMSSPSAPARNTANLSEETAPAITDVPSAGATLPAANLSSVLHSDNRLAPPPQVVTEPKLISWTKPIYPAAGRVSNAQGLVTVTAQIDVSGSVITARAINGPLILRQAAVDAVKQWKYSPGLLDGKPTTSLITVAVQFHLN